MIRYTPNHKKIVEGLVWIAQNAPGIDHYHIAKIFFYADKLHLNTYGRPIFGDKYVALKYGPVPSLALNAISRNEHFVDRSIIQDVEKALDIELKGNVQHVTPKRDPDLDVFSRTDISMLTESLAENKDKSFDQLVEDTHAEPSWIRAWEGRGSSTNPSMDLELLIDDSDNKDDIIDYIKSTAACLSL